MRQLFTLITAAVLLCLFCTSAHCHKIRVFAYSEGESIIGEASFGGGKKARETTITVTDKDSGTHLLTVKTDSDGTFTFPIPETARAKKINMLITADAGEGHKNAWLLEAADYIPGAAAGLPTASQEISPVPPAPDSAYHPSPAISEEQLRRIVDEAVASQLGPVKHLLAKNSERKISIQDILGGLGYIVGLAGIAAYMKSRQGAHHDS